MLLDTHAALWLVTGQPMKGGARSAIATSQSTRVLLFSAISAWEIGMLVKGRRLGLSKSVAEWVEDLHSTHLVDSVPVDWEIAVEANMLPGAFHNDPADRFLVATARTLGVPIVTRDRLILAYAQAGHVQAVEC